MELRSSLLQAGALHRLKLRFFEEGNSEFLGTVHQFVKAKIQ